MPAVIVATWCDDGRPDAMTAAWTAICCHDPPCAGVAVRSTRLTYENLEARPAFTLNVPRRSAAEGVDYLGLVSGRKDPDKVARAGFEVASASVVEAPILVSCPVSLECRVVERLALGSHTWFVGQVMETQVDETLVGPDGTVDVGALDPLIFCTSSRNYHCLGAPVAKAFSVGRGLKL
jgi:flavin reductase (DIM6/NTAB) family NADH-FMN oxidoreductase RutF